MLSVAFLHASAIIDETDGGYDLQLRSLQRWCAQAGQVIELCGLGGQGVSYKDRNDAEACPVLGRIISLSACYTRREASIVINP